MPDDTEDAAFSKALERFRASLTKDQREQFVGCNKKEVEKTIAEIQKQHGAQRQQKNMRRISKFIEGMSQLGQVVEVFLNVDISVAFIWGPIKFLLQTASTWIDTLDLLLEKYAEIGETLPRLSQYGTLFSRYPSIGKQLENYYCDVLEFNKIALEVFSRPAWKTFFHSTWKTFKTNFGPILANFKLHQRLLSEEKLTALMSEMQGLTGSTGNQIQQLRHDLSRMDTQNQAKILAETEETQREQRRKLRDELGAPDFLQDQEDSFAILRENSSGDWFTKEDLFQDWSKLSETQSSFIFLSGIPGAGKTTLTSGVVNHLLEFKRTIKPNGNKLSVAYFYFKHMSDNKRNLQGMMQSILSQLVEQDPSLLDYIYREMCGGASLSSGRLKELTETAIQSQQFCFLVVDGLDECARYEAPKKNEAEKVLEWLKYLNASSLSAQGNLRVFVSGHRDGVIEELLKEYPVLQLETMKPHEIDIERYSRLKAQEICRTFSSSHLAIADKIVEKITAASMGMFLYAKVVLDNLLEQLTVFDFEIEMEDRNFPKKLEQAYARVVERVLKTPEAKKRHIAEKILGWVVCANRPLRWREIQSLFCIDPKAGTADMRHRPLKSCKYFCGSLIEITGCNNNNVDVNEGRVELVHISAKQYLIHTQLICLASEHVKMTLFSSRYLISEPFDLQAIDKTQDYALSGYYNLHDYVVTSWWHHANESFKYASTSCPTEMLSEMFISLSRHLQKHFTAQTADEIVDDSSLEHILTKFHQLPADHRTREESGSLKQRTRAIREVLETLWKLNPQHTTTKDSLGLQLYGPVRYKCPHSWCRCFEDGFPLRRERDDHINQHLRPFCCTVEGCYGTSLGFSSQLQLQEHDRRHHNEPGEPLFFVSQRSKEYKDVRVAISEGSLEAVIAAIQKEKEHKSSISFDFDIRPQGRGPTKRTTPLEYAAKCGRFDVCQYLLSEGVPPLAKSPGRGKHSASALQLAIDRNDADIISLLVSQAQTAEIYDMMRVDKDNQLRHATEEAQTIFMSALELYHPEIVLPIHWIRNALVHKQPKFIEFYFSRQGKSCEDESLLDFFESSREAVWYFGITSRECVRTLLYHIRGEKALEPIFFEACASGNHDVLSYLPPMQLKLSDWHDFTYYLDEFAREHETITSAHPLLRVIERFRPRNAWTILGTAFRFLPLEPWIHGLDRTALQEMLRADDTLLFKKDDAGATLLHGFVTVNDVEMVKFITSVDLDAQIYTPAFDESVRIHMYRPEQMRDQKVLTAADRGKYERDLQKMWDTLKENPPHTSAHETANTRICELSTIIWNEISAIRQKGRALTPIMLALQRLMNTNVEIAQHPDESREVTLALLDTGRINMSSLCIADELYLLVAAAKTLDAIVMRAVIQKGHSRLCPTVTKHEARRLVLHLPHNATDLLAISALESGVQIVSRELVLMKQAEYIETYSLIKSLVEHEDFPIARNFLLKSYNNSISSDEREVLMAYAIETNDTSLLRRLMNGDVINRAVFLIAVNGLPELFAAVPRDRHAIKNFRREDGKTPLQIAQFHHNTAVEQWLSEPGK